MTYFKVNKTMKTNLKLIQVQVINYVKGKKGVMPRELGNYITPNEFIEKPIYMGLLEHNSNRVINPSDIDNDDIETYINYASKVMCNNSFISVNLYKEFMITLNHQVSRSIENIEGVIDNGLSGEFKHSINLDYNMGNRLIDRKKRAMDFYRNNDTGKFFSNKEGVINYYGSLNGATDAMKAESGGESTVVNTVSSNLPSVSMVRDLSLEFGLNDDVFNTKKRNIYLDIFQKGTFPAKNEKHEFDCRDIIDFLKHLVADETEYIHLCRHLRTKLTTLKYSPKIIFFQGVEGSGKGVFTQLLSRIVGEDNIASEVTQKTLLGEFNSYLDGTLFACVSELTTRGESKKKKDLLLLKLKQMSGAELSAIRLMREDVRYIDNRTTLILSSNETGLNYGLNDRRFFVIKCNKKLSKSDMYKKTDGAVVDGGILNKDQIKEFCYYLLREYDNLSELDYHQAPSTVSKKKDVFEAMTSLEKLLLAVKERKIDYLYDQACIYTHSNTDTRITDDWNKDRIYLSKIVSLAYRLEKDMNSDATYSKNLEVSRVLRTLGLNDNKTRTKLDGKMDYFFPLDGARDYLENLEKEV